MSNLDDIDLQDYLPWIVCAALWLAAAPFRLAVLLLLPTNARYIWHPLNGLWHRVRFSTPLWP